MMVNLAEHAYFPDLYLNYKWLKEALKGLTVDRTLTAPLKI